MHIQARCPPCGWDGTWFPIFNKPKKNSLCSLLFWLHFSLSRSLFLFLFSFFCYDSRFCMWYLYLKAQNHNTKPAAVNINPQATHNAQRTSNEQRAQTTQNFQLQLWTLEKNESKKHNKETPTECMWSSVYYSFSNCAWAWVSFWGKRANPCCWLDAKYCLALSVNATRRKMPKQNPPEQKKYQSDREKILNLGQCT